MASKLNTDIYDISKYVDELQKQHMLDISENTLMMSTFGYIADVEKHLLQNAIIVASENANEVFPNTAKFDRNVLAHAVIASITDINAVPSRMEILIGFNQLELLSNMGDGTYFILDNNINIMIEDFEYHLDYPIRIDVSTAASSIYDIPGSTPKYSSYASANSNAVYIAKYLMEENNPMSDAEVPYLYPPMKMNVGGDLFILVKATIRQVEYQFVNFKIVSEDSIINKTFDFEFTNQLANFSITATNIDGTINYIIPLFDGTTILDDGKKYCYYQYIGTNKIRVKFIMDSYDPKLNDSIDVKVQTTRGTEGNFTYNKDIIVEPISTKYIYNNISMLIRPESGDSDGGLDRKTTSELRQIIPKENLARKSITSTRDLTNHFNMLDDRFNKMEFNKKIDNPLERTYYSYILIKDEKGNVVPTNTVDLTFTKTQVISVNNSLVIPAGTTVYLDSKNKATLSRPTDPVFYEFKTPYLINIKHDLLAAYKLDVIDIKYNTLYSYINQDTFLQFILSRINVKRVKSPANKFSISTIIGQNILQEKGIVTVGPDGAITDNNLMRIYAIIKDKQLNSYYLKGRIAQYIEASKEYKIEFDITVVDGYITADDIMKVKGLNKVSTVLGSTTEQQVELGINTPLTVYIFTKLPDEPFSGPGGMDGDIPEVNQWNLCNSYNSQKPIEFWMDYHNIISSVVKVIPNDINNPSAGYYYSAKSVPVVGSNYMNVPDRASYVINYLIGRKLYIDDALKTLEDSFNIDFKFFNTYGPSRTFIAGYDRIRLDRTNVGLKFRLRLDVSAEKNTKEAVTADIKKFVENINESGNMYISKLTTYLDNKYAGQIIAIDFVGINKYPSSVQYIEKDITIENAVPEFLNISNIGTGTTYVPDIQIDIV